MKKISFIFFVLLFYSCSTKKENEKIILGDVQVRYHQLGEGEFPRQNDVISASILITNENMDTIHYVPDYPYFFKIGNSKVDSIFMYMQAGDSISFKVKRALLNEYFKFYQLLKTDSGNAILNIKLNEIFSDEQKAKDAEFKLLSKRELDEQAALNKLLKVNFTDFENIRGVYRKITHKTDGIPIAYGDELTINYIGRFLDGYVFDNTYLKGRAPSFIYGKDYQLIDGIHYGLIGMKEGESVKIILTSRRAFGEEGSIAGIVPPFTTVIFEINIIKVTKK